MVDQLDVPNAEKNDRSPHRPSIVSQELPDTVANFVDFVKEGHSKHRYRYNMHTRYRGLLRRLKFLLRHDCCIHIFHLILFHWCTKVLGQRHQVQCEHHHRHANKIWDRMVQQVCSSDLVHQAHRSRKITILEVKLIDFALAGPWFPNELFLISDYQQNYQLLNLRRGRGRILPATPNKPPDIDFSVLTPNPRASIFNWVFLVAEYLINFVFLFFSSFLQSYAQRHQSVATPHSVHAFPHSYSTTFYQPHNRRDSFNPQFFDKERELLERQIDFERELETERFVNSLYVNRFYGQLKWILLSFLISLKAETSPVGTPLSFEDAYLMGRTGRGLPPINDHKMKSSTIVSGRNIDLDEEDWCWFVCIYSRFSLFK